MEKIRIVQISPFFLAFDELATGTAFQLRQRRSSRTVEYAAHPALSLLVNLAP